MSSNKLFKLWHDCKCLFCFFLCAGFAIRSWLIINCSWAYHELIMELWVILVIVIGAIVVISLALSLICCLFECVMCECLRCIVCPPCLCPDGGCRCGCCCVWHYFAFSYSLMLLEEKAKMWSKQYQMYDGKSIWIVQHHFKTCVIFYLKQLNHQLPTDFLLIF